MLKRVAVPFAAAATAALVVGALYLIIKMIRYGNLEDIDSAYFFLPTAPLRSPRD